MSNLYNKLTINGPPTPAPPMYFTGAPRLYDENGVVPHAIQAHGGHIDPMQDFKTTPSHHEPFSRHPRFF
jgi:hypothetical protein